LTPQAVLLSTNICPRHLLRFHRLILMLKLKAITAAHLLHIYLHGVNSSLECVMEISIFVASGSREKFTYDIYVFSCCASSA